MTVGGLPLSNLTAADPADPADPAATARRKLSPISSPISFAARNPATKASPAPGVSMASATSEVELSG